ncbi:MAG: prepilin-type N-terminal cleavage/methylation domain-containing protein [bacterium]|nr:prepilin-type N-terminal cleavage/methylation domain-containing protein [bacterium]
MKKEKGFTLIELLVVVAIVGILAAIAIPQFAAYRTRAYNSTAETDLRNSITAQEAAFVDNDAYQSCADAVACEVLPGFKATKDGNAASVMSAFSHTAAADGQSFDATATHNNGDLRYDYDSATGVITSAPA